MFSTPTNVEYFCIILVIVEHPLVLWQVGLFIPSCNYPFCSLFILNHTTSYSKMTLTFFAYGISNYYNPQYISIYGIVGLHLFLCDGPWLTHAPPYKGNDKQ